MVLEIFMKKLIAILLFAVAAFLPSSANAAANCIGNVTNLITYASGDVMIYASWRNQWTVICNVNQERQGVKPQTCFTWFSNISSSMTEDKQVRIYYTTIDQAECATMPTYGSAPVPYYVLLER